MGKTAPVNEVLTSLALVLVFVLVGGYFSASELALVSLRDSQVDRLAGKRGDRVRKLRSDSNRFLASVQVGVTLAGFFASAYGGSTLSGPLGELLAAWGVPAGIAGTVAFIAVTAFISYLSLVLGELVPKRLALQRSERVALFVAPTLDRVATLTRPSSGCCRCRRTPSCGCSASTRGRGARRSPRRSCATWSARTASWAPRSAGCSATCSAPPTASSGP